MNNLSITFTSINDEIKLHYKYKISYDKVWVAKQNVLEHLSSSHEEYFENLSRFLSAIKKSNPGTAIDWTHKENIDDSTIVFYKFFVI